jgi:hypothetical protein
MVSNIQRLSTEYELDHAQASAADKILGMESGLLLVDG